MDLALLIWGLDVVLVFEEIEKRPAAPNEKEFDYRRGSYIY